MSGDDRGWREYSHIQMPLKSTVPSAMPKFLEINTTDKCLILSQNGVKLQSSFFAETKCFLADGNQARTLAARKPALSVAVFTREEDLLMSF